jgi:hypothetical protein
MNDQLLYFVVGDRGLNSGDGIFVNTLEEMRDQLISTRNTRKWVLVISMHGSEFLLATRGGFLRNPNAPGAYNSNRIINIFEVNNAFINWRNRYGPYKVMLNACQLNSKFERVIFKALLRPGSNQQSTGLGKSCRPDTFLEPMAIEKNVHIKTRTDWRKKCSPAQRTLLLRKLQEWNDKYGYFGVIKVSSKKEALLHYYFDEEPKGWWARVKVSINREETDISYYLRQSNGDFHRQCKRHISPLKGKKSTITPPENKKSIFDK